MTPTARKYIPALSLKWLTPFYDGLIEGPMSSLGMRNDLLAEMGDLNGKRVLDVGCGTGSMALMIKKAFPAAEVVGLDGDPHILAVAHTKARDRGLAIQFEEGMSFELPFPDRSFDAVITTMMLHHLDREAKQSTAAEMHRVLRAGGRLHGMDFAEPHRPVGRALRPMLRPLERVADNLDGYLPAIFAAAGFKAYHETRHYVLGLLALFQGAKG